MPRVLFDKNVPYPLKRQLPSGYRVKTAEEEGWGQVSNGELISCAEKFGYQILLTCDQNVRYQQKPDRPANLDDRSGIEYLVGRAAKDR
jgi:hypothetical protein